MTENLLLEILKPLPVSPAEEANLEEMRIGEEIVGIVPENLRPLYCAIKRGSKFLEAKAIQEKSKGVKPSAEIMGQVNLLETLSRIFWAQIETETGIRSPYTLVRKGWNLTEVKTGGNLLM